MPTLPLESNDGVNEAEGDEPHDNSDTESCCSYASSIDSPEWEPLEIDENDVIITQGY